MDTGQQMAMSTMAGASVQANTHTYTQTDTFSCKGLTHRRLQVNK